MSKILKATHEGDLEIGDKALNCAVLDDGTRILTATAVFVAFDRPRKGKSSEPYRADQMPSFINANNLQPFVSEKLREWTKPVEYIDLNSNVKSGYNARILPALSKVYLDAREANKLLKTQERFARIAEIVLLALSEVGITALVDEATGYQYDREKKELQKILKQYISEELLPWSKRFPDEFYREVFRLNGWDYTVNGIKKRPGVIGNWTKKYVYSQLPKGVLKELTRKTPKSKKGNYTARFHQSLSEDVGNPHLEKQLISVITLMNISKDWNEFLSFFEKKYGQQTLDFESTRIIEPKLKETRHGDLSSFNNTLKKLVNIPPPEKKK